MNIAYTLTCHLTSKIYNYACDDLFYEWKRYGIYSGFMHWLDIMQNCLRWRNHNCVHVTFFSNLKEK